MIANNAHITLERQHGALVAAAKLLAQQLDDPRYTVAQRKQIGKDLYFMQKDLAQLRKGQLPDENAYFYMAAQLSLDPALTQRLLREARTLRNADLKQLRHDDDALTERRPEPQPT